MNKVVKATANEKKELFLSTADKMSINVAAAEKDFWIVWVLGVLFTLPGWSNRLRFKGGTSLSKAYGLIERFSEDIDLILDWQGLSTEPPQGKRSKTKQAELNKSINEAAQKLIAERLLPDLLKAVNPICSAEIDEVDPHTINIQYPAEFSAGYLRPVIRLEIGPLAAMLPMQVMPIKSYAAECFPHVFEVPSVEVPTISAERTFWEKATILHAEAHRPSQKALPIRYARHYYDFYRLSQSNCANKALADVDLLKDVVQFKQKFYASSWASYDTATVLEIKLMPVEHHLKALKDDYKAMQEMIFGKAPSFEQVLQLLADMEEQIHALEKH